LTDAEDAVMDVRKMRQLGQIAFGALALSLVSAPAFAQEGGGGLDIIGMFETMGYVAWGVAIVLFIMSFWSVGVAIERIYTYSQARKQSKLYAPQVAKHLKDGRLKEAIALSAMTFSTPCAARFSAPPRSPRRT
jgi:hypothetical protein